MFIKNLFNPFVKVAFLCFLSCSLFTRPICAGTFPLSPGPDLVVGIVVDKMRYDYITRMWNMFGDDGFKRLVTEGSTFNNLRYDYLINQSSPGYATIFTGANPSSHGIIADHWYDRGKNDIRSATVDQDAAAIGGSFVNGRRSPSGMLNSTVGDELRKASNFKSRVYSVAMNDGAAVLSGGFSANAAWWFDDTNGLWMSSSFYLDSLPEWVTEFNSVRLPDTYLDRTWEPLLEASSYFGINKGKDDQPFSYNFKRLSRRKEDYGLIRATPYSNTITKDFAISLIINEKLGAGGHTDMLNIGFSATGEIDSQYGTFSPELQDAYLRLDEDIAYFLDFLDRHYGKSQVLVFLTSDSAVSYPSSYNEYARIPGGTFSPAMAISLLRSYLNIFYGPGDWISHYNAGMIYLNHKFIEDNNIPFSEIQGRVSRFLNQFTGIAGSVTDDVLSRNYFRDGISARIQAGYHPMRSGDVMIYLQQGWYERSFIDDQLKLISYDQHVPLVFYGWNTENKSINRKVSVTDIAPTISRLLNIPAPPFATGEPVMELLGE